jgi:small-conductance mechanosensitive channel
MRPYTISLRLYGILAVLLAIFLAIDIVFEGVIPVFGNIFATFFLIIGFLVAYTIGAGYLVRRIPDEASKLTAIRIFMALMAGFGAMIGLLIWVEDAAQIVLIVGVIWGAILIALRDLIQNFIGSLTLLTTGEYRIGDQIRLQGFYGLVIDIGIFRTTLMELDRESGDHPTGDIVTIPNGILFREIITNTTRHLSIVTDELRITVPFDSDLRVVRDAFTAAVRKHTGEIERRAEGELRQLREKKFLPDLDTKPAINLLLSDSGIGVVVKYVTTSQDRAAIRSRIIEEISGDLPEIMHVVPGQPINR